MQSNNNWKIKGGSLKGSNKLVIEKKAINIVFNLIEQKDNVNDVVVGIKQAIKEMFESEPIESFSKRSNIDIEKIDQNQAHYTATKKYCKDNNIPYSEVNQIRYVIQKDDKVKSNYEKSIELSQAIINKAELDKEYYIKRIEKIINNIFTNVLGVKYDANKTYDIKLPISRIIITSKELNINPTIFDDIMISDNPLKIVDKFRDNIHDKIIENNEDEYDIDSFKIIEVGYGYKTNKEKKRRIYMNIEEIESFIEKNDNGDLYRSVYCYNNTTPSKFSPKICNPYFDIDSNAKTKELRIEESKQTAIKLINYFYTEFNVDRNIWQIKFSGNQGFHLVLPFKLFGLKPLRYFEDFMAIITKELNNKLFKSKTIAPLDDNVQKWDQLLGIENTIHPETNLFRIPFTYNELIRTDFVQYILEKAKAKNEVEYITDVEVNKKLSDWVQPFITKARKNFKPSRLSNSKTATSFYKEQKVEELYPCVKDVIIPGLSIGNSFGFAGRVALISALNDLRRSEEETREIGEKIFSSFKYEKHQKDYLREFNVRRGYFDDIQIPCTELRNQYGVDLNKQCANCPKIQKNLDYEDNCQQNFDSYRIEGQKEVLECLNYLEEHPSQSMIAEIPLGVGKTYNTSKYASRIAKEKNQRTMILSANKEACRESFNELEDTGCSVLFEGINTSGMCLKSGNCKSCEYNVLHKTKNEKGIWTYQHKNYEDVSYYNFQGKHDVERVKEIIAQEEWSICPRKLLQYIISEQAQIVVFNIYFLIQKNWRKIINFTPDIVLIDEFHKLIDLCINQNNMVFPLVATSTTHQRIHINKCTKNCKKCETVFACGKLQYTPYHNIEDFLIYIRQGIEYFKELKSTSNKSIFNQELINFEALEYNLELLHNALKDIKSNNLLESIESKVRKFKKNNGYKLKEKSDDYESKQYEQIYDELEFKPCINESEIEDIETFDKIIKNNDWFNDGNIKRIDNDKSSQIKDLKHLIELMHHAGSSKLKSLLTFVKRSNSIDYCHIKLLTYDVNQQDEILKFLNEQQFFACSGTLYDRFTTSCLLDNPNIKIRSFESKVPKNILILHHQYKKGNKSSEYSYMPLAMSNNDVFNIIEESNVDNTLIFANNKNQCGIVKKTFDELADVNKHKIITTDFGRTRKSYKLFGEDNRKGILITYIRSDLTTGKNLPAFDLNIIKGKAFSEFSDYLAFSNYLIHNMKRIADRLNIKDIEINNVNTTKLQELFPNQELNDIKLFLLQLKNTTNNDDVENRRQYLSYLLNQNRKNNIIQASLRNHRNADKFRVSLIITDFDYFSMPRYLHNRVLPTFSYFKLNQEVFSNYNNTDKKSENFRTFQKELLVNKIIDFCEVNKNE